MLCLLGLPQAFNREHLCQIKGPSLCFALAVNDLLQGPIQESAEGGLAARLDPGLSLVQIDFQLLHPNSNQGTIRTELLLF